jgi:hypothetical protein
MKQPSAKLETIRLSELKRVSLIFPGDLYLLAVWQMAMNLAYTRNHPGSRARQTIRGLASAYVSLTWSQGWNWTVAEIEARIKEAGMPWLPLLILTKRLIPCTSVFQPSSWERDQIIILSDGLSTGASDSISAATIAHCTIAHWISGL